MLPTSDELNQMRNDLNRQMLPGTCTILFATRTTDTTSGQIETWGTVATQVRCRLDTVAVRDGISEVIFALNLELIKRFVSM